jgi:hypothetical protein
LNHGIKIVLILLVISVIINKLNSQVIDFHDELTNFVIDKIDSVFIFTDDLAVTAYGKNLKQLQFKNNEIFAEDIPPTLNLKNPIGAILYNQNYSYEEIPVIIGRLDRKIPLDQLVRRYFLNMSNFKGHSEKGGIKINVWQKNLLRKFFLIFLKNGQIFGSDNDNSLPITSKNFSKFNINKLPEIVNMIAGVWIYPPEIGVNQITAEILRLMQTGPLLVEYWDGLGWQFLEEAFLSQVIKGDPGRVRMAFSLYPPETIINYSAMISGGLTEIINKHHLFSALDFVGIEYQVLEGEKINFPIPGKVKMHSAITPEKKDEGIFQSAFSIIKNFHPPLLFLHYHGLDDLNHSFGPYGERTVKYFQRLWQWHQMLRKEWSGNILIVSDHGAHSIENEAQFNQKLITKDTKGTHGDFIFADMAVPVIEQAGLGKRTINPKLTKEQAEQIWELLGTPLSVCNKSNAEQPGTLEIIINNQSKFFTIDSDSNLFSQEFYFDYLKKGIPLRGHFKGIRLIDLLNGIDLSSIKQIVAYSFDGLQVAYSNDDLMNNELVVGLKPDVQQSVEAFTLYPLKDKFPNRMVKQLKRIEVF